MLGLSFSITISVKCGYQNRKVNGLALSAIRYVRLPNLLVIHNWVDIESRDSVGIQGVILLSSTKALFTYHAGEADYVF